MDFIISNNNISRPRFNERFNEIQIELFDYLKSFEIIDVIKSFVA